MADINEETVRARAEYAWEYHSQARSQFLTAERLLKSEYDVPQDVEDLGITIYQPAKARAIFAKALSICRSRARESIEVLPIDGTGKEEERCTQLEKYARAVMRRAAEGRRVDPYLEWIMWFLAYGKGVLELRFLPQYLDPESGRFPIRPMAPEADTVAEITGDQGVLYYVKEYERVKLDIETELEDLWAEEKGWDLPDLGEHKETDLIQIVEYWDDEQTALLVDDQLVWIHPHHYGFCPIVVCYCEPLPFSEPEYWGQGMILPIEDDLKQHAIMMSKLLSALELAYWPQVMYQDPSGAWQVSQAFPGAVFEGNPNAGPVQIINQQVNAELLQHADAWVSEDMNLMSGLPPLSFGKEPSGDPSGYLVAQILGQILDRYQQKLEDIGRAKGEHVQQIFRLTRELLGDEWGDVTDGKGFSVSGQPEPGQRKRALVTITEEDVEAVRQVEVQIQPTLAQEEMMATERAERMRQPGADGRPLMSDKSLRTDVLHIESPDEEEERITEQMMRALPEVRAQEAAKWMAERAEEEKKGKPKPPEGPQEYACPQCGFRAMSEQNMVGKPCPNCGTPLELSSGMQPQPAGPGPMGQMPQQQGEIPRPPAELGGSVTPGREMMDLIRQQTEQMGQVPPGMRGRRR